jgi:hypothetical protein
MRQVNFFLIQMQKTIIEIYLIFEPVKRSIQGER